MDPASAVAARVRDVYRDDLVADAGLVHVTSVWAAPNGGWSSIRMGPDAPASATDAFVLAVARARADAIVTTGANLRAEPDLEHGMPDDVAGWRAERLGKRTSPTTVVLTGRADLDLGHPLLGGASAAVIVTNRTSAAQIRARIAERGGGERAVEVVARERTEPRDVLRWLETERQYRTVLVEAGMRVSRTLYEPPIAIDELMLSIYCGATLADRAQGETFLEAGDPLRARLEAGPGTAREFECLEQSGPWRFQRHRIARDFTASR